MKRFTLYVGTIAAVFLLNISLTQAQQSEHEKHHPNQKKVESQVEKKSGTMMGGGMMQGMEKEGNMCGMMDKKNGGMMGGNRMNGGMMKGNMMQGGMMNSMMEMMGSMGPLHKYQHTIHHLVKQAENLNLTDTQIAKLKELRADFRKRQADLQANLKKKQIDLELVLDQKASTSDVRSALKGVYDSRLEIEISVYEGAQKMLSILTPEQKKKWEQASAKGSCSMMGMMGQKQAKTK